MTYLPYVELQTNPALTPSAAVIWLHGLGANGHDFASVVPELDLPDDISVRFIFPHAPSIPITVNNGYVMPGWYDIFEMSLGRKVDVVQLRASANKIVELIEREIAQGIPSDKIIIAGFSQGGAVAYETVLSFDQPLAGLLVLSSYFATSATIVTHDANKKTPILIQHGSEDSVVSEMLGQRAYRQLMDLEYNVAYESYVMDHTLCAEQITSISHWLQERLK